MLKMMMMEMRSIKSSLPYFMMLFKKNSKFGRPKARKMRSAVLRRMRWKRKTVCQITKGN